MPPTIRLAAPDDAEQVQAVYAPYCHTGVRAARYTLSMSAPAFLCPACSGGLSDCVCCDRPFAGAPAFLCDACAAEASGRCVRCGRAAGGPRAALCGACGVTSDDCVLCGGPVSG